MSSLSPCSSISSAEVDWDWPFSTSSSSSSSTFLDFLIIPEDEANNTFKTGFRRSGSFSSLDVFSSTSFPLERGSYKSDALQEFLPSSSIADSFAVNPTAASQSRSSDLLDFDDFLHDSEERISRVLPQQQLYRPEGKRGINITENIAPRSSYKNSILQQAPHGAALTISATNSVLAKGMQSTTESNPFESTSATEQLLQDISQFQITGKSADFGAVSSFGSTNLVPSPPSSSTAFLAAEPKLPPRTGEAGKKDGQMEMSRPSSGALLAAKPELSTTEEAERQQDGQMAMSAHSAAVFLAGEPTVARIGEAIHKDGQLRFPAEGGSKLDQPNEAIPSSSCLPPYSYNATGHLSSILMRELKQAILMTSTVPLVHDVVPSYKMQQEVLLNVNSSSATSGFEKSDMTLQQSLFQFRQPSTLAQMVLSVAATNGEGTLNESFDSTSLNQIPRIATIAAKRSQHSEGEATKNSLLRSKNTHKRVHKHQETSGLQKLSTPLAPQDNDILLGRGYGVNQHPGNLRFRSFITQFRQVYLRTPVTEQKTCISQMLVGMCKAPFLYDGKWVESRFLRFDKERKVWEEVSDEIARRKIAHLLRSRDHHDRPMPLERLPT